MEGSLVGGPNSCLGSIGRRRFITDGGYDLRVRQRTGTRIAHGCPPPRAPWLRSHRVARAPNPHHVPVCPRRVAARHRHGLGVYERLPRVDPRTISALQRAGGARKAPRARPLIGTMTLLVCGLALEIAGTVTWLYS